MYVLTSSDHAKSYSQEVFPAPNPAFLTALQRSNMLVYSCGSLWTSIVPCLVLRGVPSAIAWSGTLRHKVLLLNGQHDRETDGLDALNFVEYVGPI